MKALLFGAGAVGLGVASCLLESGVEVDIVARGETALALRREGLSRTGIFGNMVAAPRVLTLFAHVSEIEKWDYDYVLMCTKSFDTEQAAKEISGAINQSGDSSADQTIFVLFQNGWGNAEIASSFLPRERIFNARVITGFQRRSLAAVEATVHADAIRIGSLFGSPQSAVEPLCRAVTAGGIPTEPSSQISRELWAKLLYNCPLNPLGALFGARYGELAESRELRMVMEAIIREAFEVMIASGFDAHWATAEKYIGVFYNQLVPPTRDHFPSTLQDLRAGRKTEIDALNGAVVRLAAQKELSVPVNAAVLQMVKFRESRGSVV